jgi:hypothetical protein
MDAAAGLRTIATGGTLELDEAGRQRAKALAAAPAPTCRPETHMNRLPALKAAKPLGSVRARMAVPAIVAGRRRQRRPPLPRILRRHHQE